jgi:hypothetical protein
VIDRSEKSAEVVVDGGQTQSKDRTRRSGIRSDDVLEMASDVRIGGAVQRGLGETGFDHLGSDED